MGIKKNKGFTLMELMTTIVLIGLIAAFALPNYTKSVNKTKERDARNQLITIHAANNIYRAQELGYWQSATTNSLPTINNALNLNIISIQNLVYTYTATAPSSFTAEATYQQGASTIFKVRITQAPISSTNPCCAAGTCIVATAACT